MVVLGAAGIGGQQQQELTVPASVVPGHLGQPENSPSGCPATLSLVAPPLLFSPGRRGSRAGQRAGQSEQVAVSVEVGPSTSWFELPSPSLPLAWHR